MKKTFAILLSLVLMLSLAVPAMAAGTGSITITPPSNIDETATNTYKIYKVFDADGNGNNIRYTLVAGKTTAPAGFRVDAAGNVTYAGTEGATELTAADIAAIAEYVKNDTPVATATSIGTADAVANDLPNGYYYITTTTGTAVVITSTNPDAEVKDKNIVPDLDKKIIGASSLDEDGKKALAQVGTDVEFKVEIKVKKGAMGYVFHDKMEPSLSYKNDVQVYIGDTKVDAENYDTTTAEGDTLTVTFKDEWIKDQVDKTITVKYSATVTSDALTQDPANNTAYLNYGNKYSTEKKTTAVYNAKFTVTKQNGDKQPLAGAGFVIKNAAGKYYKLADGVVSWVDTIAEATEYTSDATGAVPAFTGLANGTYTLVENTVPAGYNMAADFTFTIAEHDYTAANLEQATTVINNAGTTLPETGGMGTTIFYIVGGVMVAAAVVLLITKKRMSAEG